MTVEVTEWLNWWQTISYSGFKQDWIVVMPSKYRKLFFWKNYPFWEKFCFGRCSSNVKNDWKGYRGSQRMRNIKLFWFQTGFDSCNSLEISKIVDFLEKWPPFERNSAPAGVPVMSKRSGKVVEGLNVRKTFSYSGFKQDWIVVMPSKYRKLMIFGKITPFLEKLYPRRYSSNVKNNWGGHKGVRRMPNN